METRFWCSDITSLTDIDITPASAISMNDPVLNGHITLFEVKKKQLIVQNVARHVALI